MKKISLLGAFFMMAVMLFTSCLGEGSNEDTRKAVGIVRFDSQSSKFVLDTSPFGTVYSPVFNSPEMAYNEGACYLLELTVNYDLPENSPEAINSNGFYTVIVNWKYEVDRYAIYGGSSIDTSTVLTNEIPIIDPLLSIDGYVKGVLFFQHGVEKSDDQSISCRLTYDMESMFTEEGQERIYDVFLRATKNTEGTKTPSKAAIASAYDMKYYLESAARKEADEKNTRVNLRLNYASEIKDGKITWKKTEKIPIDVTLILPNQSN